MKTIYIRRLDGEIVTCPINTDIRDHVEIIADEVEDLWK